MRHQGASYGEHLLFASRESASPLTGTFGEPREQRVHRLQILQYATPVAIGVGSRFQVFPHSQIGEDLTPLLRMRDA